MAKKFIDSELFNDSWFMSISKDAKIFWIYLITSCNHAGIIDLNEKLTKIQTGIKDLKKVKNELGKRLIKVKDKENYYFIPKYLKYQYPNFPNSNVKQQFSALKILEDFNLITKGLIRVSKDLAKYYVYDNDNVHDNGNGNGKPKKPEKPEIPLFNEFLAYAKEKLPEVSKEHLKLKYNAWLENDWKDGNDKPIKNWKSKLLHTLPHIKKEEGKKSDFYKEIEEATNDKKAKHKS